ncbi:hypothetical protein [Microbacterium sp.]|uniref:hypothetical protein n=1 Tax=Microbacterium sp. TaxID=51671 RepID=UPI00334207FA
MTPESSPRTPVARRTIVRGAAWSLPVIAAATAVPRAVASGGLALSFDRSTYPVDPWTPFTSTVSAVRDGAPAPGESVTVTVTDGLIFPDGTSRYTGVTDSNGSLALPPLSPPSTGGAFQISATLTAEAGIRSTTATAAGTRGDTASGPVPVPAARSHRRSG